jgi:integrase/recombinase XerD
LRVPLLVAFGEFAWAHGARSVEDLPLHVDPFVRVRVERFDPRRAADRGVAREVRGPLEQMLGVVVPGFVSDRHRPWPFAAELPGFFEYLEGERGLRPASIAGYRHHLSRLEAYLARIGVTRLSELSPAILSAFIAERAGSGLAKVSLFQCCAALRVFLRYAHRESVIARDLSRAVEGPQIYRLADIPRSITWEEVGQVLAGVDRRTPCGKRDWAILMLLVTYGLRSREVAALRLDHIDSRRERLAVPERKAGHSTAFQLSTVVGEALVDYLRHGRPQTGERRVFFRRSRR